LNIILFILDNLYDQQFKNRITNNFTIKENEENIKRRKLYQDELAIQVEEKKREKLEKKKKEEELNRKEEENYLLYL
jgi:hypothetical protein